MTSELLSHFPYIGLICTSMLLFLSVFLGVLVWTFRKNAVSKYQRMECLPLEGGDHE